MASVLPWGMLYLVSLATSRWRPGPRLPATAAEYPCTQATEGLLAADST